MAQRQGQRDSGKERFWRRMLRLWQCSGLSVRDFCGSRDLSEQSFYRWRRIISECERQATQTPQGVGDGQGQDGAAVPIFVPVRLTASRPASANTPLEVVV